MANRRTFIKQMGFGAAGLGLVSIFPGCRTSSGFGRSSALPRSSPETEGISSASIIEFLDALAQSRHEFHSLMILRNGRVVTEGWWAPYAPELNHTMYSMSKSFTSTGIGFAVSEGRLSVEDRVVSFFPEKRPAQISDNLAAMRVKDLLTMSTGHERDTLFPVIATQDWAKAFLEIPVQRQPGTHFVYNSGATYMLSAILQKASGQTLLNYLRPRLFEPLGIEGMTWETCPEGIPVGGWGLSVPTEALAKFGQLYLREGRWNGRSILPASWIREATALQVQQPRPLNPGRPNETNDWLQGYGYQFWRCRYDAYRGDGAFGQYTIVLPKQNAVVAITGESPDMQGELDLVWKHLLPAMKEGRMAPDRGSSGRLLDRLATLELPKPKGSHSSPLSTEMSGKRFQIEQNSLGLKEVSVRFSNEGCVLSFQDSHENHVIACGIGKWKQGETALPGTPPRLVPRARTSSRTPSKVAACGAWKDNKTFEMIWRYNETPHSDTVTCTFDGDQISVRFLGSIARISGGQNDSRPALTGRVVST